MYRASYVLFALGLLAAVESHSRTGRLKSLFQDGTVWTNDGKKADEDWFAFTLDRAVPVQRVTFAHGKCEPAGGWFDTSAGKPKVQVQKAKDGPWMTAGELADYPETTAQSFNKSKLGQGGVRFVLTLDQPMQAFGVSVLGKPSCGDKPE